MTYGYIRVSSDRQTVENQRFEIGNFCKRQNLCIDGWIEETISGTKNYYKHKLGGLLNIVQKGDLIICAELSRLGRNLFMIMEILHISLARKKTDGSILVRPKGGRTSPEKHKTQKNLFTNLCFSGKTNLEHGIWE